MSSVLHVKVLVGTFNQEKEGPSRDLLNDCEIFANVSTSTSRERDRERDVPKTMPRRCLMLCRARAVSISCVIQSAAPRAAHCHHRHVPRATSPGVRGHVVHAARQHVSTYYACKGQKALQHFHLHHKWFTLFKDWKVDIGLQIGNPGFSICSCHERAVI